MEHKRCIACKQPIEVDALKCHHCKQIQNKLANIHNKPSFTIFSIILIILFVGWIVFEIITTPSKSEYSDFVASDNFELSIQDANGEIVVSCFGDFKNNSDW